MWIHAFGILRKGDDVDVRLQPHPLHGRFKLQALVRVRSCFASATYRFEGHVLYGIRSVSVFANRLQAAVIDCGIAAKSADARDKYFLVSAAGFDASSAKSLKAELPASEAAQAALSSTITELAKVMPQAKACAASHMIQEASSKQQNEFHVDYSKMQSFGSSLPDATPTTGMDALLAEARSTIVAVRSALA